MLSPAETMNLLKDIEDSVNVEAWAYREVHLWPLIRATIGMGSFGPMPTDTQQSKRSGFGRGFVQNGLHSVQARLSDRTSSARLRSSTDAVLLGDGVSRIWVEGAFRDRLCGPFIRLMEEMGMSSLLLEPSHTYSIPRHEPSVFVQGRIDRSWFRAKIIRRLRSESLEYSGYAEMTQACVTAGIDGRLLNESAIREQAIQVDLLTGMFGRVLDRLQPEIAFLVDWNIPTFAFNRACSDRQIPTVEIQHGVMSPYHWAYSSWTRIPRDGYPELPSIFWCWRHEDVETISRWASQTTRHRAVLGGNLWTREWKRGVVGSPSRESTLPSPPVGGKNILVTLQRGLATTEDLRSIIDAVSEAPPEWRWWIRLHPLMSGPESESAMALFPESLRTNATVASTRPLFELLPQMDAHVTHSSSVVLEASDFGVPSVITGVEFESLFEGMAQSSPVPILFAREGKSLLKTLREAGTHTEIAGAAVDPIPVMRSILARSAGG